MKKSYLTLIFLISIFMMSCSGHFFNPRYYYNKSSSSSSSSSDGLTIEEAEPPAEIPADQDPFKVKSEFNTPSYGGYEASQFDSWLFKASFQGNKLPIYTFFNDNNGRYWIAGGKDWNDIPANYYKPNDGENEASGYDISSMTVYKYDRDNPLYDDNGYLPGRMDRFRFYSIQGTAVVADLKQYLIAVDTYSKFVFAFGKITETKSVVFDVVPTKFDAVENYGNKIHFYEYDPIGYVDRSGEVIFYQHYIDEFVENPTGYFPKQKGYENYAQHDQTRPGKSPYFPLNDNTEASAEDQQKYKDDVKTYLDIVYQYRDYSGYKDTGTSQLDLTGWKNGGHVGKSLMLYKYKLTDNLNKLEVEEVEFGKQIGGTTTKTYNLKMINTSYKATYVNAADPSDTLSVSIVQNDSGVNTISIGGNVLDKNFKDYGPIFTDRVMGATFSRGNVSYTFEADGTKFVLKEGSKSWTYTLARFDNDIENNYRATYECNGWYYWVKSDDPNGKTVNSPVSGFTIGLPGFDYGSDDYEADRQP
ncbi:hypothetical protein R4Q14_06085 [Brachyspira intermedia]|uniref:hypothetical protein n=1 Tax=Brachyspira intermedia TaxID=84377 RepID=UPI003004CDFC